MNSAFTTMAPIAAAGFLTLLYVCAAIPHITGAMQRQAAQKIERGIGHSEAYEPHETLDDQLFPPKAENRL